MEYYVKYYDVLYDKENFKEDIVLKGTDTYIITEVKRNIMRMEKYFNV